MGSFESAVWTATGRRAGRRLHIAGTGLGVRSFVLKGKGELRPHLSVCLSVCLSVSCFMQDLRSSAHLHSVRFSPQAVFTLRCVSVFSPQAVFTLRCVSVPRHSVTGGSECFVEF